MGASATPKAPKTLKPYQGLKLIENAADIIQIDLNRKNPKTLSGIETPIFLGT